MITDMIILIIIFIVFFSYLSISIYVYFSVIEL